MLGLILFFQILIILLIIISFIVLKQQHKDININISTTRRIVRNMKTDMTIEELKEDINTYVLVKFPESQKYMNFKQCHACIDVEGAYFVPKHIYNREKQI